LQMQTAEDDAAKDSETDVVFKTFRALYASNGTSVIRESLTSSRKEEEEAKEKKMEEKEVVVEEIKGKTAVISQTGSSICDINSSLVYRP